MANTPVTIYHDLEGFASPLLLLYPVNGGGPANGAGDALSQSNNGDYAWNAIVSESLEGVYRYEVVSDGIAVAWGFLRLKDTTDRCHGGYTIGDVELGGDATQAKQDEILARLGAWTGSGINTVLGAFRAIFNKGVGLTPSDLIAGIDAEDQGNNEIHSLPAILEKLGPPTISVIGGNDFTVEGNLFVISKDDYKQEEARSVEFKSEDWPDLTGAEVTFRAKLQGRSTGAASYFNQGSTSGIRDYAEVGVELVSTGVDEQIVKLELPTSATNLQAGTYFVHIVAILSNGHRITLLRAPEGMIVYSIVQDEDE